MNCCNTLSHRDPVSPPLPAVPLCKTGQALVVKELTFVQSEHDCNQLVNLSPENLTVGKEAERGSHTRRLRQDEANSAAVNHGRNPLACYCPRRHWIFLRCSPVLRPMLPILEAHAPPLCELRSVDALIPGMRACVSWESLEELVSCVNCELPSPKLPIM